MPNSLRIFEVKTKKDLKAYIHLPAKIHKYQSNWVPPIYMDEWVFYNPKKNLAFSHSSTILLLAEREGEIVGRIMGIINHQYNEQQGVKDARFCFFETYNDFVVAQALLKKVEDWAAEKEMVRVIGPLGFSDKDPQDRKSVV